MEQKIKFIIIGVGAVLAISIFINLQTYTAKRIIQRERDSLKTENVTLTKKIEEDARYTQGLLEKINGLNSDLEKIIKEKEEIQGQKEQFQKQYEQMVKAGEDFNAKYKDQLWKLKEGAKEPSLSKTEDTYWAGILQAKADLELQMENLRSELKTLKINNEELQRDKSALELELRGLAQEKTGLEQEMGYQQKMFDNMTSERILETNTKRQLQERLDVLKNDNAILKRQLKILSQHKINLETKLQRVQEEKFTFERRFNEMSLLLEERLSQVGDLKQQLGAFRGGRGPEISVPKKESIELPPIVVYPQAGKASLPQSLPQEKVSAVTPQGKISAVNQEDNFVIIDLGEDRGIKIGDTFQVYSEGKPIATISVIQVRRDIAACDIKKEVASIRVGDTIR